MTKEELILELRGCHTHTARVDALLERRARLRAKLYSPKNITWPGGVPKGGEACRGGFEAMVAAVDKLEGQIAECIQSELQRQARVEELLQYACPEGRAVLDLFYIQRYPMWIVARNLCYDRSTCWRYLNRALDEILKSCDAMRL